MTTDAVQARGHVLRTFGWYEGHADFARVFHDAAALASLGPGLTEPFREKGITAVVGAEARAFILGAVCAVALGAGFVPARKPGSVHPGEKVEVTSRPDWRGRRSTFRMARVLSRSDRVLIVDDWIETGSQASAVAEAVGRMGAQIIGTSVIVNQAPAEVRTALNVVGLVDHDELPVGTQT